MKLLNPMAPTYLLGGNAVMHIVLAINGFFLAKKAYINGEHFDFHMSNTDKTYEKGTIKERENYNDVIYMIGAHVLCVLFMLTHWVSKWYVLKYLRETSVIASFFTYMCFIIYVF